MKHTLKQLEAIVGTLSAPSKMPCHGYSTPAARCKVGSKLRKDSNSTCASCYAAKGRYLFPNVQDAMERRFHSLANLDLWTTTMIGLIGRKEKSGYFRWHDSGDLQSVDHLDAIATIATNLPDIQFWIPTREYKFVKQWKELHGNFPSNLMVRMSAYFKGQPATMKDQPSSTVGWSESKHECPSRHQNNMCGSCRACWDPKVPNVDYPLH